MTPRMPSCFAASVATSSRTSGSASFACFSVSSAWIRCEATDKRRRRLLLVDEPGVLDDAGARA